MDKEELIAKRIKESIENAGLSYYDLAKMTKIPKSALQRYATGETRKIPIDRLETLAKVLKVETAYLFGWIEAGQSIPKKKLPGIKIPVLGRIQAGVPVEAIEDIVDYEEITHEESLTGCFFGLVINGESMAPRMLPGDVVIVRQQSNAETGDIVVVLIDGCDATVKQLRIEPSGIALIPANPSFNVLRYSAEEVSSLPVKILGVVYELRGKYKKF